ncbi:MAG: protein kinase [Planctomycetes bacterium]|nr:protein kinase [Planctomycetota bacterium]MBL7040461.1 protein kinase [Pirellulaceae bacterium]
MAVTSSEAFLQVLKKSGLLSQEEFDEVLQTYGSDNDPKSIARTLIKNGIINKWQALQLLAGRHALMLGKYKLLDQIVAEPKQRVYLAEHAQMGRRVAIKVLSRQHATENPQAVKRFLDQASKVAALDHRNIVHVYDVESRDELHYVILEHVEGRSLKRILDEHGPMPTEKAVVYVSHVAGGLAYAYERKHVHGDIRPANLLVDGQDVVKIANLGVKGLMPADTDDKGDAVAPAYVAPEKRAGDSTGDHRSDIYSLGCVMYALLTGHPPEEQAGESPSLLDDRPDVPEPLAAVCERMMAHDPAERYQTAGDVQEHLDEWLASAGHAKSAPATGEAAAAASDARPPKAAAPPPRKTAQEKQAPKQQAPSGSPRKQEPVAADAAANPLKAPAPAAKLRKPTTTAKQDKAETKAKPAPAAGAVGGFAIDTERRRRPKKGKPAAAGGPAKAAAAAGTSEAKSKLPLIIGGAVVGGLVLVTCVVLLALFLFSDGDGDGVDVAQGENGEASAGDPADATGTDAGTESDPESDPETDPETDPVSTTETDPEPGPDDGSAGSETSEDIGTETPDADGSGGTTSKPADEPGSAAGAKKKATATETKSNTDTTAKVPDTAQEKPVTKKPVDENPGTKAVAKKPPAKKPPAKPAKKPFEEFPKLVALPDLEAADAMNPKKLGPVYVAADDLCFIKLRGGENACKGSQTFVMRNADGGLAERDWEIMLRDGEADPGTKIAHLSLGDDWQLSFTWQSEAKTQPSAPHVANCALMLSCSGESHIALLREPTRVEGMAVDLQKVVSKQDWTIDMPPDPSAIRLEITGVGGAKYSVDPAPTFNADRSEAWVKLEDGGGLLVLKLESSLKRSLQVTLMPHIKSSPDGKPERLNVRMIQQTKLGLQHVVQDRQIKINQANQAMRSKQYTETDKKRMIQPRLATFKVELEQAEKALQQCESLEKMLNEASLTMNFRVFYDADSSEVDLLHIGG